MWGGGVSVPNGAQDSNFLEQWMVGDIGNTY